MGDMDVIESLRQKEEELEGMLNKAREKAAEIKKDALQKAEEIRLSMSKDINAMTEEYRKAEAGKIDKEVEAVKEEAIKDARYLKSMAEERLEEAVEDVVSYIMQTQDSRLKVEN